MLTILEMSSLIDTIVYIKLRMHSSHNTYSLSVYGDNWELNLKWGTNIIITGIDDLLMPNLLNTFFKYYFWDKQTVLLTLSLSVSKPIIFFALQDLSSQILLLSFAFNTPISIMLFDTFNKSLTYKRK